MKLKHLFATLLIAVVALTTAGCGDFFEAPPDGDPPTSATTRATGEPGAGTAGKPAGTTAARPPAGR